MDVTVSVCECVHILGNSRASLTKALRKRSVPETIWPAGEDGWAEEVEAPLAVIHHRVSAVEALGVALLRVTNGVLHKPRIRTVYHCKIKTARCLMSDRPSKSEERQKSMEGLNRGIAGAVSRAISINSDPKRLLSFLRSCVNSVLLFSHIPGTHLEQSSIAKLTGVHVVSTCDSVHEALILSRLSWQIYRDHVAMLRFFSTGNRCTLFLARSADTNSVTALRLKKDWS